MTDFKRRTLFLSNGKQIKLFGNSIAIGRSLEIGEGYAPNIFSWLEQSLEEKNASAMLKESQEIKSSKERPLQKTLGSVVNPHQLTAGDLMEIADFNIRLWLDLKDNIRKYGTSDPKIFNRET